jgi:hypothetical protein
MFILGRLCRFLDKTFSQILRPFDHVPFWLVLRLETLKTFGAWFWDLIVFLSECTHYLIWIFGKW